MQLIKAGFKSNKLMTLVGLMLAIAYVLPELTDSTYDMRNASYGQSRLLAAKGIPLPIRKPGNLPYVEQPIQVDIGSLEAEWSNADFDLGHIRYGQAVPRLFVDQIPVDILDIQDVEKRKQVFISVVLPLILNNNEKTLSQRDRLMSLISARKSGQTLLAADENWLQNLATRYREDPYQLDSLLLKVDAIPVSMALAQAVEESGWGTSRFAREGNALFGQRVWGQGKGIVPAQRAEGETYEVRAFDTLSESISSYSHNLNVHPSYEMFRTERARRSGEPDNPLNGYKLTETLTTYSERGQDYINALQNLIQANRFDQLENAQLVRERLAGNRL
ncbi:glucosaminidase domain-containing protein [Sneathiella marina]|uniref:Glucosaminidase domain-containing protein n=1 Tax=Sneathiella marina TaxID=2950108 RepID=A0ABY4W1Y6_9PROT|nr:glucosaminidase domain-containing protein [Sneathiella marina]USG61197.1 glucosaminidase domain-containing protein [Sneathiella marina]